MALSYEDQEFCRRLAKWFYDEEPATVNEEMAEVLAEMLKKTLEGSHMMDLVPRPAGGPPGVAWLVSQAVQAWFRTQREQRVYEAVKRSVAWGYKSKYRMAEAGI